MLPKLNLEILNFDFRLPTFDFRCLCVSLPVHAQTDWTEIVTTSLGDRIMVNENSVRVINRGRLRLVNFNVKTLYSTPESDGTIKTVVKYSADCLTNTLGTHSLTKYDRNNQILVDYKHGGGYVPVQAGSVGEFLYEYGCKHLQH